MNIKEKIGYYIRKIRLPKWIKNKYFIVLFLGAVWIAFFDHSSIYIQYQYYRQLHKLERTHKYYESEIKIMDSMLGLLTGADSFYLEKYARENYLFKKVGETIYIIPDIDQ